MSIIQKCELSNTYDRRVKEDEEGTRKYTMTWKIGVTEPNLTANQVLAAAREGGIGVTDRVPFVGEPYVNVGGDDPYAACTEVECGLMDPEDPFWWEAKAEFEIRGFALTLSFPSENPLKWPVRHWFEYIEEQTVVESAYCLDNLYAIRRGPKFGINEPGPVVNAAGQQTVDPLMESGFRIILNCTVYYPDVRYAAALNLQFGGTVHSDPLFLDEFPDHQFDSERVPLLMGSPHGTWKFLLATAEKIQYRKVSGEDSGVGEGDGTSAPPGYVPYCETTIKFEFRLGSLIPVPYYVRVEEQDGEGRTIISYETRYRYAQQGWIRRILNNGQVCIFSWFDKFYGRPVVVRDPALPDVYHPKLNPDDPNEPPLPKYPLLVPGIVYQLDEGFSLTYFDDRQPPILAPRPGPDVTDLERLEASEPVNLDHWGTQITDPSQITYIHYWTLRPANYYEITDYFGNPILPSYIEMPTFPLPRR